MRIALAALAVASSFATSAYAAEDFVGERWTPKFQNVVADNGQLYRVDLNSIPKRQPNEGARALVCIEQGGGCSLYTTEEMFFDCRGRYTIPAHGLGVWEYAPPKSIAAEISRLACSPQ